MDISMTSICKVFVYTLSILSSIEQTCAEIKFTSSPTYEVAKLGEKITLKYTLSEKKGIRFEKLVNDTSDEIYKTPNFITEYNNRWQVTPSSGESTTYTFVNNKAEKIDGMFLNVTIDDAASTDFVTTAISLYNSDPTMVKYPTSALTEGQKFNLLCEFNLWGSTKIGMIYIMKGKQLSSTTSTTTFYNGLVTVNIPFTASMDMDDQDIHCQVKLHKTGNDNFIMLKSKTVKFRVEYKSQDIKIISNSSDSNKTTIEIVCSAAGNPTPKYEWRKKSSSVIISTNATLIIQKDSDKDTYECTAWNTVNGTKHALTETYTFKPDNTSMANRIDVMLFVYFLLILSIMI